MLSTCLNKDLLLILICSDIKSHLTLHLRIYPLKIMEYKREYARVAIYDYWIEGKSVKQIHRILHSRWGSHAPTAQAIYNWISAF